MSVRNTAGIAGPLRRGAARAALLVAAGLLLLVVPHEAWGQAKVGTTGAQFLELGVSARAMGMAEAFTAVADDISAVYYNPAGLTSLYGKEVGLTYLKMPADVNFAFGAIGLPLEQIGGVLGISFTGLSTDEMDVYEYAGRTGQTFLWQDMAVGISYGRFLTDRFSIGFSVRYLREDVMEYSANGWSADVGTMYDTGFRGFKIAMVITNFGPDMKFITNDYPLPINFKFGGAINVVEANDYLVTLAAEGWHPSDNLEKYNSGLEFVYRDMFMLRAGGRFNYDADGLTTGGGVKLPFGEDQELRIDYAFQDMGVLSESHRFTMSLAF